MNDAAMIVLARSAAHYDPKLTSFEQDMLKKVTGGFSRVVLVIAAPGYMELTPEARACHAIVFLGLAGQEAGYALADVVSGKVCPSGKLSFSWPETLESFGLAAQQLDGFFGYRPVSVRLRPWLRQGRAQLRERGTGRLRRDGKRRG